MIYMENKFVVRPRKPAFGKTSVVSARLPDDMIEELDKVAKQTGRTRNELIQMCIDFALKILRYQNNRKIPRMTGLSIWGLLLLLNQK